MTRIIFAGGGTGGHLYPGLAIARALVKARPSIRPFFVGAQRGIERDVLPTTEFPHALLDLHPLYRRAIWNNAKTIVGGARAWRQVGSLVKSERPALVVGTGGYAAGVMLGYSVVHGIPIVQQAGDSSPGLVARFFSSRSIEVYLNFPEAKAALTAHHAGSLIDTGAPIDPPPEPRPDKRAARQAWGFPATGGHVLLISGASQGSLAINRVVEKWITGGLPDDLHLIWSTGRGTYDQFKHLESEHVRVREYLAPIADAYAAADLALSRAGAMTTAEQFAWGIPSLLVPLPTAAADHQTSNAVALERAGAAIHLPQATLSAATVDATVRGLIANPERFGQLVHAAQLRARPTAAATIAQRILAIVDSSGGDGL